MYFFSICVCFFFILLKYIIDLAKQSVRRHFRQNPRKSYRSSFDWTSSKDTKNSKDQRGRIQVSRHLECPKVETRREEVQFSVLRTNIDTKKGDNDYYIWSFREVTQKKCCFLIRICAHWST